MVKLNIKITVQQHTTAGVTRITIIKKMMTNIMLANVLCTFLHAVLLLQLQILLPQSVDGVNHDLDQLDLGVSQPVLVRDIVSAT